MAGGLFRNGARRVWQSWKWGFICAAVIFLIVYIIGLNIEVLHKRSGLESDEPVKFFSTEISQEITTGMNTYTVTINNNQKYTITHVDMRFTPELQAPHEPETYSGAVERRSEEIFYIEITRGISRVDLTLEGEEYPIDPTDINLYVQNPNGTTEWVSDSNDNIESITLTAPDFNDWGYGSYTVIVRHETGARAVPFDLTIRTTFNPLIQYESCKVINPGEARTFDFVLYLDESQLDLLRFNISAKVELPDGMTMTIQKEYNANWQVVSQYTPTPADLKYTEPWGPVDITGTSSAAAYVIAIFSGVLLWARVRTVEAVKPKHMGPIHCFISLISLILAIDHILLALQKTWPWTSSGMMFSYAAISVLFVFTVFSFFDVEGQEWLGKVKWRWVHIFLTLFLALLMILHIGLVGDHLGFLK